MAILACFQNTKFHALAPFSLSLSFIWPWAMSFYKHAIAGAVKSGFTPTLFSPCNSPPATTYPFVKNVVEIASHSRKIKT
jgi:hypothetical protein